MSNGLLPQREIRRVAQQQAQHRVHDKAVVDRPSIASDLLQGNLNL